MRGSLKPLTKILIWASCHLRIFTTGDNLQSKELWAIYGSYGYSPVPKFINSYDHKNQFLTVIYSGHVSINSCNIIKKNHPNSLLLNSLYIYPIFFSEIYVFSRCTEATIERELKKNHVHLVYIILSTIYNFVFLRVCNLVPRVLSYSSSGRMSRGETWERGWTSV